MFNKATSEYFLKFKILENSAAHFHQKFASNDFFFSAMEFAKLLYDQF
jgi:hypothetical protein